MLISTSARDIKVLKQFLLRILQERLHCLTFTTDDDRIVENVLETFFKNFSSKNFSLYLIHFLKKATLGQFYFIFFTTLI